MEFLFELAAEIAIEFVFEGGIVATKSSKIPKYIRYPLIGIMSLLFIAVIGLVFLTGILVFQKNIFIGIFFISIGSIMLVMSVIKFRKVYLTKISKE